MEPHEVFLNRPLLDRILTEEGVDPEIAAGIRVYLASYRKTVSRERQLWDDSRGIVVRGEGAKGIAFVYTDHHRSLEDICCTLAHELGHAVDGIAPTHIRSLRIAWVIYLCLFVTGGVLLLSTPFVPGRLPDWMMEREIPTKFLLWLISFFAAALAFFPIAGRIFYRYSKSERSARRWEKRLTSREDWDMVVVLAERPSGS